MLHELLNDPEFWVLVAFVIAITLVVRKGKPAILRMLDERAARAKAEIAEAEQLRDEAKTLLDQYQKKQHEALADAKAIMQHAAEEAARNRDAAAAELAAALKRREQHAMERIAQAEAKATQEVRAFAVDLAIAATRKLIEGNLDASRATQLVDQAISELPQRLH